MFLVKVFTRRAQKKLILVKLFAWSMDGKEDGKRL